MIHTISQPISEGGGGGGSAEPTIVSFEDETEVVIAHGLGRFVLCQVIDDDGLQIEAQIVHTTNDVTITFTEAVTGTILYL